MTTFKHRRNKAGRITAWLVTWEWAGDHARREDKIAAILSRRLTPERITEIVEMIYANESYTYRERIAFAKDKKLNPYRATCIPWQRRLRCGHNPWLEARLVDNLHVIQDSDGVEQLSWDERSKPDISWTKKRPLGENET
jgi:hypothetical protein